MTRPATASAGHRGNGEREVPRVLAPSPGQLPVPGSALNLPRAAPTAGASASAAGPSHVRVASGSLSDSESESESDRDSEPVEDIFLMTAPRLSGTNLKGSQLQVAGARTGNSTPSPPTRSRVPNRSRRCLVRVASLLQSNFWAY